MGVNNEEGEACKTGGAECVDGTVVRGGNQGFKGETLKRRSLQRGEKEKVLY